jgi:hypothetical protein
VIDAATETRTMPYPRVKSHGDGAESGFEALILRGSDSPFKRLSGRRPEVRFLPDLCHARLLVKRKR